MAEPEDYHDFDKPISLIAALTLDILDQIAKPSRVRTNEQANGALIDISLSHYSMGELGILRFRDLGDDRTRFRLIDPRIPSIDELVRHKQYAIEDGDFLLKVIGGELTVEEEYAYYAEEIEELMDLRIKEWIRIVELYGSHLKDEEEFLHSQVPTRSPRMKATLSIDDIPSEYRSRYPSRQSTRLRWRILWKRIKPRLENNALRQAIANEVGISRTTLSKIIAWAEVDPYAER